MQAMSSETKIILQALTLQSTIWNKSIKWLKDSENSKWVLGSLLVPLLIWAMDKLLF